MAQIVQFSASTSSSDDTTQSSGPFGLARLAVVDWATLWIAALIPVAHVSMLQYPSMSMRYGLVLLALPAGFIALVRLATHGDTPSLLALAFCGTISLSAIFAPATLLSFKGHLNSNAFVFLYVGVIALWALGRTLTADAVKLVGPVVVTATAVNVMIGVVQIVFGIYGGPLATFEGRASGLLGNAAFYGSAVVGAASYSMVRAAASSSTRWLAITAGLTFGTSISGSRGAIFTLIAVLVGTCLRCRLMAARMALATAVGLVGATVFTQLCSGTTAAGRLASKGGDGRLQMWRLDVRVFLERPILGWGLGNHALAVRPHFTEAFTRNYAWDGYLMSWNDPHNIVMLLLVSTGAIGTLLIGGFVAVQFRNVSDLALMAGFLATAVTWLLQPASLHSLPIAMLMLGASGRSIRIGEAIRSVSAAALALTFGVGSLLAGLFLVPNALTKAALERGTAHETGSAAAWIWVDPNVANAVAWKFAYSVSVDPTLMDEAIKRSKEPTEIAPDLAFYWTEHAKRLIQLGRYDDVPAALARAFALERWNPSAWQTQLSYAAAIRDYDLADETREVVCRLDLFMCVTGTRGPTFDLGS